MKTRRMATSRTAPRRPMATRDDDPDKRDAILTAWLFGVLVLGSALTLLVTH